MAFPAWWQTIPPEEVWNPVTNNDAYSGDWIQIIEGMEQPGGGTMLTKDDKVDTLVGLTPAQKQYSAELGIVGASWAVGSPDYQLVRINPLPHPNGDHKMRASSVDFTGYNPFPKNQTTPPADPVYMPFKAAPYLPAPNGYDGNPAMRLPGYTNYSRSRTTIKFKPVNYPMLEESEMWSLVGETPTRLSEVFRNVAFFDEVSPILEGIQATNGAPFLEWADSAAVGGAPLSGQEIASEFVEYIQRANLAAIWYAVPHDFIVSPGEYFPWKIFDTIGKVNDADWYGFPEGTLRFEAPRFRKYVQAAVRAIPNSYTLPFVYDIVLPFAYYNPTMAAIAGGGSPQYRGWNGYPFSRSGLHYAVRRISNGEPYFPMSNFHRIFEHAEY